MSNPIKPKPVTIQLDKERSLLFDLNSFAEIEEIYGSVEEAMAALEKGSLKAVRAILWAGLIHEDVSLTLQRVGAMITLPELPLISESIKQAFEESMPAEMLEEVGSPNVQAPRKKRGTGAPSITPAQ